MKLDEIKMSPGIIKAQASKLTDAKIGVEFELIVKDVGFDPDEDFTSEIDYSADESVNDYSWPQLSRDIQNFFREHSANGRGEIQYILDQAENMYNKWAEEQWDEFVNDRFDLWASGREETHPDESDADRRAEFQEIYYEDRFKDHGYIDISNWLGEEELTRMRDWADRFNLAWPYFTESPDSGLGEGSQSFSEIAGSFSKTVGMPLNVHTQYHKGERTDTHYIMEPDSSLRADNYRDLGLEFVSPPLSIDTMIKQIHAVRHWAVDKGFAYTNESCGLHMNVSFPGFDLDNLDYVKLALFLGDDWVSTQFGRLGASYARSTLDDIKLKAHYSQDYVRDIFDKMKQSLMLQASKLIHMGPTEKYMTINTHDNRVEFRAPGGNWLEMDIDVVITTMLRCVLALHIALDPEKYKKEYASKLYALISPAKSDIINLFSQYQSGDITLLQLKQQWAKLKLSPKRGVDPNPKAQPLAKKIAAQKYWRIFSNESLENLYQFKAAGWQEAMDIARKYARDHNLTDDEWDISPIVYG